MGPRMITEFRPASDMPWRHPVSGRLLSQYGLR